LRILEFLEELVSRWLFLVQFSLFLLLVILVTSALGWFIMWFVTTSVMDAFYATVFDWLGIWKRGRP